MKKRVEDREKMIEEMHQTISDLSRNGKLDEISRVLKDAELKIAASQNHSDKYKECSEKLKSTSVEYSEFECVETFTVNPGVRCPYRFSPYGSNGGDVTYWLPNIFERPIEVVKKTVKAKKTETFNLSEKRKIEGVSETVAKKRKISIAPASMFGPDFSY
jgi:hypothetical protein